MHSPVGSRLDSGQHSRQALQNRGTRRHPPATLHSGARRRTINSGSVTYPAKAVGVATATGGLWKFGSSVASFVGSAMKHTLVSTGLVRSS